ncbi:MAG: ATP-dependent helicase [Actinobacteria bacterium]|nr:ATP-dependent helicase [Actinomycetota bacterium]
MGDTLAGLFDHILVDEYQGTNIVQRDILTGMRKGLGGITVVGDDAQAIYSFRAATVDNILGFERHFAGARTVVLEDNYRSTQAILDVSNAVIRAAPKRHKKELRAVGGGGTRPCSRPASTRPTSPRPCACESSKDLRRTSSSSPAWQRVTNRAPASSKSYRWTNPARREISLVPPLLDDDYLVLSTIHSAKGCEWDAVHVIHAADGMIPSGMATGSDDGIAEERRLFYVALTRARRMLYLYWPRRYYHRRAGHDDAHNYAQITRFLPRGAGSPRPRDTWTEPNRGIALRRAGRSRHRRRRTRRPLPLAARKSS